MNIDTVSFIIFNIIIAIIWYYTGFNVEFKRGKRSIGVKDNPTQPKPIIEPAPQSTKRNKQGRTPDEQELHEYMEDNPR